MAWGDPTVVSSEGTACSGAADPTACLAKLAELRPADGIFPDLDGYPHRATQVVYTRHDEVGAVTSAQELATFLKPITDAKTAGFLVRENGYDISCGGDERNARPSGDGFDIIGQIGGGCGRRDRTEDLLHVSKDGQITVLSSTVVERADPNCSPGRRPEGFAMAGASVDASPLGRFFAEAAELEAASVPAFLRLAEELAHHGAPADLVLHACDAARDEIRHTAMMTSLARRFGAEPSTPVVPPRPVRSLFDIALENAVEGCVHETHAALYATHQARHAADRRIRKVMKRIAEDETRHGALAWSVAAWIESLLSDEERARIDQARSDAVTTLMNGTAEPHPDVVRIAGAPSAAQASRLLHAVAGELWAA
ncbi:ferritin-like domain-containing protein [Pendulispora brunnea]|uniref:Ferritin-like domain-containing protein n=1 Tax=Pendulispora brunnea TaxID=2905690 RepID=A0ABZ2KIK4_9BACT